MTGWIDNNPPIKHGQVVEAGTPTPDHGTTLISIDQLDPFAYSGQTGPTGWEHTFFDGEKFPGGYGLTQLLHTDYWTLRQRSIELFQTNLYARGLIRRLVTNEINTGLTPEACPNEEIIGLEEDSLTDWSETVETRFGIWGKNPEICDWKGENTFGAIQRAARMESLIAGDVLIVLRQSQRTRLPQVQLISGSAVQTPFASDQAKLRTGHTIEHGIELDAQRRQVAFWVTQEDGTSKRLPARGPRSGRRLAWLVYGSDKRFDDLRGQPLLSLVLQSLKEIDRYRDSTQRKALINSFLTAAVEKNQDKPSTLPVQGGAVRKDTVTTTESDGKPRQFNIAKQMPGLVLEELQHGEKLVLKGGEGTDVNFGPFEEAIIQGVAWGNEIPPEILRLAFSNNYSASQAAINEFKIYLNKVWAEWGETFCTPIYIDFLISETLLQKINAPGFLDAWRDPAAYDIFGAWTAVDWYGSIKPSTDMLKQAKGSKLLINEAWSTNAREARITTGTKFTANIKRLKRENQLKAEAARPLLELQQEFGSNDTGRAIEALEDAALTLAEGAENGS